MGAGLTKADVGTYTYPAAGAPQLHGVASIAGTPGTTSFAYDADGNVTAETGATTRTLGWTMFNMPATISYGSKTISFQYDADHNRVMQSAPNGTTYYLPDGEQTPGASTGPVWHTYFQADGERVVEDFGSTGSLKHHFFHNDYQNTIGLVTDDTFTEAGWPSGTGIVQNELSDVFGQPRLHTGAIDPNWGAADVTKRRYINQEDLTPVQLINLNARVYDPLLGKFMSPDPVISDQDDSQSWNAYAYSHNNPMSKEDPTGLADGGGDPECNAGCLFYTGPSAAGGAWGKAHTEPQFGLRTGNKTENVTAQQAQDAISKGATASEEVLNAVNSATGGLLPTPVKSEMLLSPRGADFIKSYEGGPYLQPYSSIEGGTATIAWGHKLKTGESYPNGISLGQAESIFNNDVAPAERSVNRVVTMKMNQAQFDALTSLAFNIGTTRFVRSSIPGLLDAGNGSEALGVWADYDHVNGTVSQGLSNRRAAEINMFNGQEPAE